MKIIKLIILSFLLLFSSFSSKKNNEHPFYLSVSDIYFKPEEKIIEVATRVFADDLEEALYKLTGLEGQINGSKEPNKYHKIFEWYFNGRMHISVNDKVIPLIVLGYEMEDNAVWIYFEGTLLEAPKNVEINNSILYDFLQTQSNMVHCHFKDIRKSFKLDYPERKYKIQF